MAWVHLQWCKAQYLSPPKSLPLGGIGRQHIEHLIHRNKPDTLSMEKVNSVIGVVSQCQIHLEPIAPISVVVLNKRQDRTMLSLTLHQSCIKGPARGA